MRNWLLKNIYQLSTCQTAFSEGAAGCHYQERSRSEGCDRHAQQGAGAALSAARWTTSDVKKTYGCHVGPLHIRWKLRMCWVNHWRWITSVVDKSQVFRAAVGVPCIKSGFGCFNPHGLMLQQVCIHFSWFQAEHKAAKTELEDATDMLVRKPGWNPTKKH